MTSAPSNRDDKVVAGFGDEWSRFDQQGLTEAHRRQMFQDYFDIFPWERLPPGAQGADIGCGSGRWAQLAAPRVGTLHVVDPSPDALSVARKNLAALPNVQFHLAGVDQLPFAPASLDFAYSLGVLHHVPDTQRAMADVVTKLKPGAPLLLYLYYAFDNRPAWYRLLWRTSEVIRATVSRLPMGPRYWVSQVFALGVYWPLARTGWLLDKAHIMPRSWPLAYYRDKAFYSMRTDALDRFGTQLEQRFTQQQIRQMMQRAGLDNIQFSPNPPFWCAVGTKR